MRRVGIDPSGCKYAIIVASCIARSYVEIRWKDSAMNTFRKKILLALHLLRLPCVLALAGRVGCMVLDGGGG